MTTGNGPAPAHWTRRSFIALLAEVLAFGAFNPRGAASRAEAAGTRRRLAAVMAE